MYRWGKEWQEAWERLLVLYRQSEEAEERYHAMAPKMPAALTKTEQDWELDLCARPCDAAEDTVGRDLVEQFRHKPIVRVVQQPAPERGENRTRTTLEPWPEAQVRADEIVAAWNKYLADMRAAREQSGFEKVDETTREAVADLHVLEGRIVRMRAKTPQGMLVKARMAAVDPATVSTVDDLEHALEERLDTGHIIGLSLILDVLDLHGGDA